MTFKPNPAIDDLLHASGFFTNPYPVYHQIRSEDPVYWSETWNCWILTRYADVVAVLRDPRCFSSAGRITLFLNQLPEEARATLRPLDEHFSVQMVFQDPPDHTRLRGLVNKAFTSRVVEAIRPQIQTTVDVLLDAVQPSRQMDLIHDFAYPLPAITIAEMLGVPPEARDQFKQWADDVVAFLGTGRAKLDVLDLGQRSVLALTDWLRELIAQRRYSPKADLLNLLIATEEQGDGLGEAELIGICISLLTAGHETTTNLIGNGLLALLQHPAQRQQLQHNPDLIVTAVEELLRYDSPVQRNWRVVKEELQLGGKQISRGQLVFAMLGAANRDPAQFPDPDRLDFHRRDNRHVAFGYGIHFCVGAPLARLEGQIAINTILRRLPGLRLANEAPVWLENMAFRGLKSLPVVF